MLETIEFGVAENKPDHGRLFQAGEQFGRVTFTTVGERNGRTAALIVTLGSKILAGVDFDPEKYPDTKEQVKQALSLLHDNTDLDQLVRPVVEQDMTVTA